MMAQQRTFLCECGKINTRPLASRHPRWTPENDGESYHGLRWDFVPGDVVQVGITCNGKATSCRREYVWLKPPVGDPYVNVKRVA